jgi:hypothetical protein
MTPRNGLLLLGCLWLLSCQPRGSYLYQHPEGQTTTINNVVLVIDYLNLKDDLGDRWDFDSLQHQQLLNHLLKESSHWLQQWGYPRVTNYLLSSGLLIRQPLAVDHYQHKALQPEPLFPPYLLASEGIEEPAMHQEPLALLVKYTAPRRHHPGNPDSLRGMHIGYHFSELKLPADTAVLYLHIDQSATGIIKQLSTLLLTGALASQSDHAQVYLAANSQRQASAFLIHASGEILWKNHSTVWHPGQSVRELLVGFPINPGQ